MQGYLAEQLVCHLQVACKAHRLGLYLSWEARQQDCVQASAPAGHKVMLTNLSGLLLYVQRTQLCMHCISH